MSIEKDMPVEKDVKEVVVQLRQESEQVEVAIDKHLKAMVKFDKRFTYLLNLKNNGVRIYEEVSKENPLLLAEIAHIAHTVSTIEKYDLAEGSTTYEKLKKQEREINEQLSVLIKKKEKSLDEEMLQVGKKYKDAKSDYCVDLEKFKEINDSIKNAYGVDNVSGNNTVNNAHTEHSANSTYITNSAHSANNTAKKEVLSVQEMISRKIQGS